MLSGSSVEELQARAAELYGRGEFAAAVEEYQKLVELQPTSAHALKALGLSLIRAQRVDEGIQVCARAAVLMPTDAEVRYSYGYALGSARRYGEATEELDAALNLQPNHIGARQALIYSLLTQGRDLLQSGDAYAAERYLDRAYKLDSHNPETTGALMDAYYQTQQKGKLVKLHHDLDARTLEHPAVKAVVAKMEADSEYQTALKQAAYAGAKQTPAKPDAQTLQQIPCPNCRQMIMEWAAVCPHCNFRIKAMGTFATHDRGPEVEWQEVALTIMALIWSGLAGYNLYLALKIGPGFEMIKAFLVTLFGARLAIGIGLLFRVTWVGFIAKVLCMLSILRGLYGILIATAEDKPALMWLGIGLSVLDIAIASFLIYLINYSIGD